MKTSLEDDGPASEALDLPLAGTLVLDLSQFLAGPSCALRLADLGADVIKIERPDGGDLCRSLVLADQYVEGDSALFHTINRGKRSFAADLKDPGGLQQVQALIARADVLIHNFRPGVMERIGLDFDQVARINPRLVYAAVSGYGDSGPWRDKPGQDLLVQSLSGLAWLSGDNGDDGAGPPVPAGVSVVDVLTGAHLVQAIMAALLRRTRTGRGGKVEVSLLESALDLQFEPLTAFLNSDGAAPVRGAHQHANVHANPPYGIYRTGDGFMAVAMTPLDRLAALIDCPALARQAAEAERDGGLLRHRDALKECLQQHLATRGSAHWLALLEPAGVWAAQVMAWPELVEHAGFTTLDMTQSITSASGAVMQTTRCPIRIDGHRIFNPRGAPLLGADNDAVASQYGLPATGN